MLTLLSHYWREDDPSEMDAALARDWCDILEGMTQDATHRACQAYLRSEPRRKPTPGAIYELAFGFMPRPVVVRSAPEDRPVRVTAERAAEIMVEVGLRPRKFGGEDQQ